MSSKPHLCSFESRRAPEMQSLIEKLGGQATVAPSMQETPLEENSAVFEFAALMQAGSIDLVIYFTGVGTKTLISVLLTRMTAEVVQALLNQSAVMVRGPKPSAVLKEWGIEIDYRVPEPNTWKEVLATLDEQYSVDQKTVAVQEYGKPDLQFYEQLEQRGARLIRVPVYQWALPDDVAPLEAAIQQTIAGQFDGLLFTSAQQVHNVLSVAESVALKSDWLAAAQQIQICSIGPTCSEALRAVGLSVHCEASPPKMAQLVRLALETVQQNVAKNETR